ncbi:putative bifunctional diguanylate cyclase/phosphodiesterase [Desulfurivibrio dismutans]|uniref:putative bifunctional diguanylate cyclase/phosphodiesterase n=1 Tax=Desulfurivibrio dismutans TaxID=1398908 RepID=UPI0023DAF00F|nr:EAL domain-containing protein [Desulfurivibrio alkaliphilus]MDF1614807.1 EAL domain-containing protein [Desulfurivibrio alkaliphilus]
MTPQTRYALRLAVIYAILGALWIFFSDRLLVTMALEPEVFTLLQTYKGWLYVLLTAVLIFLLILKAEYRFQSTEQLFQQAESQRERLTYYDPLTGLPNRQLLQFHLEHALDWAQRHQTLVGIHFIDLDRFKEVNDSLGHQTGDELLAMAAQRLSGIMGQDDTLARFGGDKFILLQEVLTDPRETATKAQKMLTALAAPFRLTDQNDFFIGASIGISVFPSDGQTVSDLLKNAEAAMYHAKENGRNQFNFYTGLMNIDALERLNLENALRQAIGRRELELFFQPKLMIVPASSSLGDASGGLADSGGGHGNQGSYQLSGAEALIRWHREGKLVPPGSFIPLAEKSELIEQIGSWVIDEACRQIRAWRDQGHPERSVAVNVSARQFRAGNLAEVVAEALGKHQIPPHLLELELTESILMEKPEEAVALLTECTELGVSISLDDFGTGYSSFAYLNRFPIGALKIDQSFIRDLEHRSDAAMIADSIIGLAHQMGIIVVAEGVETISQLNYLQQRGCDQVQGYLFSPPLPAREFTRLPDRLHPA